MKMKLKITKDYIQVQHLAILSYSRSIMEDRAVSWWVCNDIMRPTPAQLRRIAKTLVKWADDMDAAKRKGGK